MKLYRFLLAFGLVVISVTTVWALCSGDSWGLHTSTITRGSQLCYANIASTTRILHFSGHGTCQKVLNAKSDMMREDTLEVVCTSGQKTATHSTGGVPETLTANKTCTMVNEGPSYFTSGLHGDVDGASNPSVSGFSIHCGADCVPQQCPEGEVWDVNACTCAPDTPIIIDVAGNGYDLTSARDGVVFDLNANGIGARIAWTSPASDDGFLAYDRNGNGFIDDGTELFGNNTPLGIAMEGEPARNGFEALLALERLFDGDVVDGRVDAQDPLFGALRIWVDANHDGISNQGELRRLGDVGLISLETSYHLSRRRDRNGNEFRLRALSWWQNQPPGRVGVPRFYFDVWLTVDTN